MTLSELPNFTARPGLRRAAPHRAGEHAAHARRSGATYHRLANEGVLPPRTWNELYLQTVFDRSVVPDGVHTLSVFAQYVPHRFREGDWDSRREEVGQVVVGSIARFCSNLPAAITGDGGAGAARHRASGSASPAGTSSRARSCRNTCGTAGCAARTPMPGVLLCGAGTHPGGSVIGVNGRNAAMEVLKEEKRAVKKKAGWW